MRFGPQSGSRVRRDTNVGNRRSRKGESLANPASLVRCKACVVREISVFKTVTTGEDPKAIGPDI